MPSEPTTPPAPGRSLRPARPAAPPLPSLDALDDTHRQILRLLSGLDRLVAKLDAPGAEAEAAELAARACRFFRGPVRRHHEAEEAFVFPHLLSGASPELLAQLRRLQQDHNWLEEDWLELEPHLQALAQGYLADHAEFLRAAMPEFVALYQEHIAIEELSIYPEARRRHLLQGKAV